MAPQRINPLGPIKADLLGRLRRHCAVEMDQQFYCIQPDIHAPHRLDRVVGHQRSAI